MQNTWKKIIVTSLEIEEVINKMRGSEFKELRQEERNEKLLNMRDIKGLFENPPSAPTLIKWRREQRLKEYKSIRANLL